MRYMKKYAVLVALLIVAAALAGCGASGRTEMPDVETPDVETPDVATPNVTAPDDAREEDAEEPVVGLNVGNLAPDFELKLRDGTTSMLSDHFDKVVFVNFWATWCGPCVVEMPHIQSIHETYPDDVYVVAVNISDSDNDVDAFIKDAGYTFDVAIDLQGAPSLYQVEAIPLTYVLSPGGVVSGFNLGSMTSEEMVAMVEKALGN